MAEAWSKIDREMHEKEGEKKLKFLIHPKLQILVYLLHAATHKSNITETTIIIHHLFNGIIKQNNKNNHNHCWEWELQSPCQLQTMSFSEGLTSSSHSFMYSRVSPADFQNSTTATSGATSNTSTVIPTFPFLPSVSPCILTVNSFFPVTLNFSFFATASTFAITVDAECFDMNIDGDRFLVSNKFRRSNPCDNEDIISNAL